jgi:hypothetical protein
MTTSWKLRGGGAVVSWLAWLRAWAGNMAGAMQAVRRRGGRGCRVMAASCVAVLAGLSAAAPAAATASTAGRATPAPGAELWASSYDGPASRIDQAAAVAAGPGGGAVFVTGSSDAGQGRINYATVAYDAATGAQLWASGYGGPVGEDFAAALAVSADGRVFVTGNSLASPTEQDYATVAYDAATGKQLWVSRYVGPGDSGASAVAVSPGGGRVFVTGLSNGTDTGWDYATVAYSAATGRQLWVSRFTSPHNHEDFARAVAVSPSGRTVFVTGDSHGRSHGASSGPDYATVAYSAATGKQLWVSRYNGPGNGVDDARSVTVGPRGRTVYVTGLSAGVTSVSDFATVAYNAATGATRWVSRYNGPRNSSAGAYSVAAGPGGHAVYVTGFNTGHGYVTISYRAATGATRWISHYRGKAGLTVAASPDGQAVYVTGTSGAGYGTVAYDAATGSQLWAAASFSNGSHAASLAVSPAGDVYVTGTSRNNPSNKDFGTIAYQG